MSARRFVVPSSFCYQPYMKFDFQQEEAQLSAIRDQMKSDVVDQVEEDTGKKPDRDFEGGFGGQEDLEDRYATTSGEH